MSQGGDNPFIARCLYETISFLLHEKKELVSETGFVNIFRIKVGQKWVMNGYNEESEGFIRDYYHFCKRFILYDFPISHIKNNIIKAFFISIRDVILKTKLSLTLSIDRKTRGLLDRIEGHLDCIYIASYHKFHDILEFISNDNNNDTLSQPESRLMGYNELDDDNERYNKGKIEIFQGVMEKTDQISSLIHEIAFNSLQRNRFVNIIDNYFGFSEKYLGSEIMIEWLFNKIITLLNDNPLVDGYNKIKGFIKERYLIIIGKKKGVLEVLNGLKSLGFCLVYETPKGIIIEIKVFWFKKTPHAIWTVLKGISDGVKGLKVLKEPKKIKVGSKAIYQRVKEELSKGKERLDKRIQDFEGMIKERKKKEFPLLGSYEKE